MALLLHLAPQLLLTLVPIPQDPPVVIPPDARAVDGNALDGRLGHDKVRLSQHIGSTMLPKPRTIGQIALRRDSRAAVSETLKWTWWHKENVHKVEIRFGAADASTRRTGLFPPLSAVSVVFAARLRLPDLPPVNGLPAWAPAFKLSKPYAYDGKGLCIDLQVSGTKWNDWCIGGYYVDAVRRRGGTTNWGTYGSGQLRAAVSGPGLGLEMFGGDATAVSVLSLGVARDTHNIVFILPTLSTGGARASFPWLPALRFHARWYQVNQGVTWSNGLDIITGPPGLDAWAIYAFGHQAKSSRGFVDDHFCLVIQLR